MPKSIAALNVLLGLDSTRFKNGMTSASKSVDKFKGKATPFNKFTKAIGSQLMGIGGIVAGAFATQKLIEFGTEAVKLAGKMEGVQNAFDHLDNPTLLSELRKATKGTVTDLELMSKAVQANNFQIPVQNLGKFFEFARRRAKGTGESVDFLVNSIVVGLGRKSPKILDNLGITTTRLKEQFNGVALESLSIAEVTDGVAQIIDEDMKNMSDDVDTHGEAIKRLSVDWENLKTEIGGAALAFVDFFQSGTEQQKLVGTMKETEETLNAIDKLISKEFKGTIFGDVLKGLEQKPTEFLNGLTEAAGTLTAGGTVKNVEKLSEAGERFTKQLFGANKLAKRFNEELKDLITISADGTITFTELGMSIKQQAIDQDNVNNRIKRTADVIGAEITALKSKRDAEAETGKETAKFTGEIKILERELFKLQNRLQGLLEAKGSFKALAFDFTEASDILIDADDPIIPPDILASDTKKIDLEVAKNEMTKKVADFSAEVSQIVKDHAVGLGVAVGQAFGDMFSGIKVDEGPFDRILDVIGSFLGSLGQALIAAGIGKIAFDNLGISGVGAVVAGVALVALSQVVKNKLAAGPGGGSGGGAGGSVPSASGGGGGFRPSVAGNNIPTGEKFNLTFKLKGRDLVTAFEKEQRVQGRVVGG